MGSIPPRPRAAAVNSAAPVRLVRVRTQARRGYISYTDTYNARLQRPRICPRKLAPTALGGSEVSATVAMRDVTAPPPHRNSRAVGGAAMLPDWCPCLAWTVTWVSVCLIALQDDVVGALKHYGAARKLDSRLTLDWCVAAPPPLHPGAAAPHLGAVCARLAQGTRGLRKSQPTRQKLCSHIADIIPAIMRGVKGGVAG